MSDIYKPPESQLTTGEEEGSYGSLEKGVTGEYDLSIGEILSEAWGRTRGNKGTIWLAAIVYFVAAAIISFVAQKIFGVTPYDIEQSDNIALAPQALYQLFVSLISAPLVAGMTMVGVKIGRGEQTSAGEVFAHFDKFLPLMVATLLMWVMVSIGFALLILPGIYLLVAYMMMIPLIADKGLGPWQALETSRKAITRHWFAFLGFVIVVILLIIVGSIPLMIGLIWVVPLVSIAYGIIYRNMFGAGPETKS